jgi:hypothetical protein
MEAILIAVRALEGRDDALEQKRSVERERKRRQRARERDTDGNVTGQSRDMDVTVPETVTEKPSLSLLPNENNSNPTTHTHPETQTPRARKGTRLPADWSPADLDDRTATEVSAWPDGAVDRELSKFRDWASAAPGAKGIKSDWDATWRNWLRKAHDEGRYRNGSNRNNGGSPASRSAARPRDGAIAELDRQLGLDDFDGSARRRDTGGGAGFGGSALTHARTM